MTRQERLSALDTQAQAEAARMDPTLPVPAVRTRATPAEGAALPAAPAAPAQPAAKQSYHDTRWPLLNRILATTDQLTHGRAGLVQRLGSYLPIGGTAALVNLGVLAVFFNFGSAKVFWYWVLANVVAYELSILANFIPNDYFTFRHLDGHRRSWLQRCLRFHLTSLSGVGVTFVLSTVLLHVLDLKWLIAQAIALIIATAYNFTVHHLFTYSHVKN